jgi:uncharacterized membrane protein YecN with MAPEG domain
MGIGAAIAAVGPFSLVALAFPSGDGAIRLAIRMHTDTHRAIPLITVAAITAEVTTAEVTTAVVMMGAVITAVTQMRVTPAIATVRVPRHPNQA